MFAWVREGAPRSGAASRRRSWTGPTTSPTPSTTSRTASSPAASTSPRSRRRGSGPRWWSSRCGTSGVEAGALAEAADALLALPVVAAVRGFSATSASAADHVALKRLTSELVGRFVHAAVDATRAAHGDRPLLRYTAGLVVPAGAAAEVALLKAVALRYVMSDPGRLAMQARQRELLVELATALLRRRAGLAGPGVRRRLDGGRRRRSPAAGGARPGRGPHRPAGSRPVCRARRYGTDRG